MKCLHHGGCMHANGPVLCVFQCQAASGLGQPLPDPEPNALANTFGMIPRQDCTQEAPSDQRFAKPTQVKRVFEPEPKLIAQLETLLADAKTGKLRSFACAMVRHDDLIQSGELNSGWHVAPGTGFALGEAITRLRHAWDIDRDKDSA